MDNSALRSVAARMAGEMRCDYCRVPTAATIEHVKPQSQGGPSQTYNLVLACPYCNTRKSTRPADEFKKSGDWQTVQPENLPGSVPEMLAEYFGWTPNMNYMPSGSTNSRLRLYRDQVIVQIRPGRKYDWTEIVLGKNDNPRVVRASYDFLFRHFTPSKPKKYRRYKKK